MNQRQTDLVVRAMAGDRESFAMLYEMYYRKIYSLVCSMVSRPKDAEDIVQEIFTVVWKKIQTIKNPELFNAWIHMIGSNLCYKYRQNKSLKLLHDAELEAGEEDMIDSKIAGSEELIPAMYVEREDLRARLQTIIGKLSDVQKQTITLYYYGDLKLAEIAEIMDCTVSTVNGRLRLAKKAIQIEIEQWEEKSGERFYGVAGIPMLPFGEAVVSILNGSMLTPPVADTILARILSGISQSAQSSAPETTELPQSSGSTNTPVFARSAAFANKGFMPIVKGFAGAVVTAAVGIGIFLAVHGGINAEAPATAAFSQITEKPQEAPEEPHEEISEKIPEVQSATGAQAPGDFIQWNDPAFEAAIRAYMGIPEAPITVSEAAILQTLHLSFPDGNANLGDLRYFPRLINLDLHGGALELAQLPLSGLNMLEGLRITATQVSDLTPLSNLNALKSLTLSDMHGFNPTGLTSLVRLKYLYLSNISALDLTLLSSLTSLDCLEISYTNVTDLTPLSNLTSLQRLCLMNTNVSDLTPLAGLPALKFLDVSYTQVTDLSPITNRVNPPFVLADGLAFGDEFLGASVDPGQTE